ncbi:MAG: glycosyltransferase [Chloroflexota bacterium]
MHLLLVVLLGVLLFLNAVALINALTLPRLRRGSVSEGRPVSVLIPARNEAAVIAETVRGLLAQDYPSLEILLLDDHSDDATAELAQQAAGGDARLRVLSGESLPEGWLGKAWACEQLGRQAAGEILIFTDADVRWLPGAVSALAAHCEQTRADLLTAWPKQLTYTWAERLVVPMMAFSVFAYLPVPAVHHIPLAPLAAAIGQCLAFRRSAYWRLGGHAAVRQSSVDDMAFAWAAKRAGLRLRMAESAGLLQARMYHNWREVCAGFAKNILAGHAGSPAFLLFSAFFHWALFLFPWLWLASGWLLSPSPLYPWGPLALVGLGVALRTATAAISRQRLRDAFFLPVSVALMTLIAIQALRWHFFGGAHWKGRPLP